MAKIAKMAYSVTSRFFLYPTDIVPLKPFLKTSQDRKEKVDLMNQNLIQRRNSNEQEFDPKTQCLYFG